MSSSPDTPKGPNFSGRTPSVRELLASQHPVLTLLKGILWAALIVAVLTALAMNYEIIWNLLTNTLPVGWEMAESALDSFFIAVVGMNPAFAQLATAYTGFVLFLAALYLVGRKVYDGYKKAQLKKNEISAIYADAWSQCYGMAQTTFLGWWNSLDYVNKIVAGTFIVLIGIPVALILSVILGSLVASLL
jgi:hypothetical protein